MQTNIREVFKAMNLFNSIKKRTRRLGLGVAAALALTTVGLAVAGNSNVAVADSGNDISSGSSATSCRDLVNKIKASKELQAIYASPEFGLYPQYYDDFASHCQHGVATRDNKVIVNGHTYATSVGSIGRWKSWQGSNPRTFKIAGAGTYYGNLDSQVFASNTNTIPVDVLINSDNDLMFAVMTTTCGNPVYFNHTQPTYACHELNMSQNLGNDTYKFSTNAGAGHGAVIDHLVYNFGDGKTATTKQPGDEVTHTFTKDSKVTVTVYVKLPNGKIVTVGNSGDCVKVVKVTPPAMVACNLLTLSQNAMDSKGNVNYKLTASATAKNAAVKSYTFTFGDGQSHTVSSATTSITHTYAPGNYTAKVLVTFVTNTGKVVTAGNDGNCVKQITVKPLATDLVCDYLKLTKGAVDTTTGNTMYTLNAAATPTNATITSYVFSFGDKTPNQTVTTNANMANTTHTYAPGTYTAQVFVNGTDVNGKAFKNVTDPYCQKTITVPPVQQPSNLVCDQLTLTKGSVDATTGKTQYTLNASATPSNTTITSYSFNFGDGQTQTVTTSARMASANVHTYAPDTYNVSVSVSGKGANGQTFTNVTSAACAKTFTVPTPECKPGVPTGSPQCSTLQCVSLSFVPGAMNDDGSQSFTLNATASVDQATITGYVFHFGDSSADQTVPTSAINSSVSHTYAASTTGYDASVTVVGKDVTGATIQNTNANCQKHITPNVQTPGVTITKVVNGVKAIQTSVGTQFTYTLKVTNNGEQNLTNVVVTDTPDQGVNLLSADRGTISNNTWTFTIPALAVGESQEFNLIGVVPTYQAGTINNTACVNAPEVNPEHPEQNDSCDTATVSVTTPPQVLPAELPNTGAGSVIGLFGASAVVGTVAYRLFLSRKLNRQ